MTLDGRDVGGLGPGVGLGALMLILLLKLESKLDDDLVWKPLGLPPGFRVAGLAAGGCAIIVAIIGLTNIP